MKPCFPEYKICSFSFLPGPPAGSTSFPRNPAPWPLPAPSPFPTPSKRAAVPRSGLQGGSAPPNLHQSTPRQTHTPKTASVKSKLFCKRSFKTIPLVMHPAAAFPVPALWGCLGSPKQLHRFWEGRRVEVLWKSKRRKALGEDVGWRWVQEAGNHP